MKLRNAPDSAPPNSTAPTNSKAATTSPTDARAPRPLTASFGLRAINRYVRHIWRDVLAHVTDDTTRADTCLARFWRRRPGRRVSAAATWVDAVEAPAPRRSAAWARTRQS